MAVTRETPPAVKLWINTTFRDSVEEQCEDVVVKGMLKHGIQVGHPIERVLRNIVCHVVLRIADMDPKEWP